MDGEKSERESEIWCDVRTASREFLQGSFEQQRDDLFREYAQLQIDIESTNRNRFADDPINLDFDMKAQYQIFKTLPLEKRNKFLAPLFEN